MYLTNVLKNLFKQDIVKDFKKEIDNIKNIDFKNIHNSSKYIKFLVYIFIIIFILLIFYTLFYSKILTDIKEEKIKIANIKKEYSKDLELISKINSIAHENYEIEKSLNLLLDKLPRNGEVSRVIEDLNLVAQKNELKVDSLIFNDNVNKEQDSNNKLLKQISYSLIIIGSYSQLLNFAYDISNMERLFILDNFSIDVIDEGVLKLSAVVKTYQYEKEYNKDAVN